MSKTAFSIGSIAIAGMLFGGYYLSLLGVDASNVRTPSGSSVSMIWRTAVLGQAVLLVRFVLARGSVSDLIADQLERQPTAAHCADRLDLVGPCFKTRGRVSFYNGNPSLRLWRVGTNRLLGLEPDETPLVPENMRGVLKRLVVGNDLFGDFVVCPLSEERPGRMQQVCVESGSNLMLRTRS